MKNTLELAFLEIPVLEIAPFRNQMLYFTNSFYSPNFLSKLLPQGVDGAQKPHSHTGLVIKRAIQFSYSSTTPSMDPLLSIGTATPTHNKDTAD